MTARQRDRMKELILIINEASFLYYSGEPKMSNILYDTYVVELLLLEDKTGHKLRHSPTRREDFLTGRTMREKRYEFF